MTNQLIITTLDLLFCRHVEAVGFRGDLVFQFARQATMALLLDIDTLI